ncbi:MAG: hypothetical protein SCH66_07805 [Methanolobus sp.]|nr:hypothetical protein [Methanolobus sp.]
MKNRYIIYGVIFLMLIFISGVFLVETNLSEWRSDYRRYHYTYSVQIDGLSGREIEGTTTIMVPIPATKDGNFVTTPSQKDPSFVKSLLQDYILHTPESHKRGPYFESTTEALDDKSISGNWTTFIAETKDGYMLGFKTDESTLEDISFIKTVVVEYVDIFDPINTNSPILYPIENTSDISMVAYGDQTIYGSNPNYDSYVYLSDNLKEETIHFDISLEAYNDPTEWAKEYRGSYLNTVQMDSDNNSSKIKVKATLKQNF